MAMKFMVVLLAFTALAAAAPRSRNIFAEYLFRRDTGGCTKEELDGLAAAGVDLAKSSIDCSNDPAQIGAGSEQQDCGHDYSANPSCCSPGCNWIMELHCMSPVQMICKRK